MIEDLFETPEWIPKDVIQVLDTFTGDNSYFEMERLIRLLKPLGYTFEYGLDATAYNLRKI
jgi:hypothetical protein